MKKNNMEKHIDDLMASPILSEITELIRKTTTPANFMRVLVFVFKTIDEAANQCMIYRNEEPANHISFMTSRELDGRVAYEVQELAKKAARKDYEERMHFDFIMNEGRSYVTEGRKGVTVEANTIIIEDAIEIAKHGGQTNSGKPCTVFTFSREHEPADVWHEFQALDYAYILDPVHKLVTISAIIVDDNVFFNNANFCDFADGRKIKHIELTGKVLNEDEWFY